VSLKTNKKLPVECIDQALDVSLPVLETLLTGADRIPKLPLYHRYHCLYLPPLTIYPIKPRLVHKLPTGYPCRVNYVPSPSNGRNYVKLGYPFPIKSTICKAKPSSPAILLLPPHRTLPLKEVQKHTVGTRPPAMSCGKDHLRLRSYCICPLPPTAIPPPCPGEIISTLMAFSKACCIKADELFLNAKELEKTPQHPFHKGLCEP